jgi:hypothetical protein
MQEVTDLNFHPTNTTFDIIEQKLKNGHHVYVQLEPGDATSYEFILIPGAPHEPVGTAREHLLYVICNLGTNRQLHHVWMGVTGAYAFDGVNNEHSRLVLAHFHNLLMEEMFP